LLLKQSHLNRFHAQNAVYEATFPVTYFSQLET
jgi:hypothetical protein